MLTSDQLDALTGPIVSLYQDYEDSVIMDIARRLGKMSLASAAWQMQRLTESGMVYEEALKELSKITGQSVEVLRQTFTKAGVKAMKFDDSIYRKVGLEPLPLNLSPAMARALASGLEKTGGVIRNLTMTTAISGQQAFESAADLAYMQVSSGAMSYDQAIRSAVKKVAADGLSVIQYAGHNDKLDVAMRRAVLTGVSQTTGQMQTNRANEMGCDLVQTSAHAGARPSHAEWQGKIFSRSGTSKKYPPFVESTGYGTGAGLGGWNCRHSFYPFFEGISENAYDEVDRESLAKKTVTLNEEKTSMYEATQVQRGIERKIRFWKRQAGALEAAGQANVDEMAKVEQWQAQMRKFIKETKLQRQRVREQV
jgi:hypothetical protein